MDMHGDFDGVDQFHVIFIGIELGISFELNRAYNRNSIIRGVQSACWYPLDIECPQRPRSAYRLWRAAYDASWVRLGSCMDLVEAEDGLDMAIFWCGSAIVPHYII